MLQWRATQAHGCEQLERLLMGSRQSHLQFILEPASSVVLPTSTRACSFLRFSTCTPECHSHLKLSSGIASHNPDSTDEVASRRPCCRHGNALQTLSYQNRSAERQGSHAGHTTPRTSLSGLSCNSYIPAYMQRIRPELLIVVDSPLLSNTATGDLTSRVYGESPLSSRDWRNQTLCRRVHG